ncbi:Zn-ribbon domain-containing OB-fold protein [Halosolutus amylolyticus]|uniref:Zn-ribbon domain-containing OB-fold protein n=1 Tax=Halosolutus amylolyticus TaxID=2932267 RepID=A0ABD5PJX5_9EURY|nr:OB-fold domain-containing protein [Halosolutus amylolyticus]
MTDGPIPVVDKCEEWDGPVPEPTGLTAEFWSETANGRFLVQQCPNCDHQQFYPRIVCTNCGREEPDWTDTSGDGEIYSFTICYTAREEAFQKLTPYVVAIVELEDGPQLTALVPADPDEITIGTPVEMRLWQVDDDAALPVFYPV